MPTRTGAILLAIAALAAGCGGGATKGTGTTTAVTGPAAAALAAAPPGARLVFAATINRTWAVAAYGSDGQTRALAVRRGLGGWKPFYGGTVRIRPLGPDPGSVLPPGQTQVAVEFSAPVKITEAGLWLDGQAVPGEPAGKPRRFTAYGASPPLGAGQHSVVAFGQAGPSASAVAWTFTVR